MVFKSDTSREEEQYTEGEDAKFHTHLADDPAKMCPSGVKSEIARWI
jgi:hypothetical protein